MAQTVDYITVISEYYDDVECYAPTDPYNYNDIVWVSSITTTIPIPQTTLDQDALNYIKERQIKMLSEEAQREIVSGFASAALGTTYYYDSTIEDQLNLVGAAQEANLTGQSLYYGCRATPGGRKQYLLHTPAQLQQVLSDGKDYKLNILLKLQNKRDLIYNATTEADVLAITWTSTP